MDTRPVPERHWGYDPDPAHLAPARRRLKEFLASVGVEPEAVASALVVATELMANAIEHAQTDLILSVGADHRRTWWVAVRDLSPAVPRIGEEPYSGLNLVNRLTDQLVWHTREGGKTVSATVFHSKSA